MHIQYKIHDFVVMNLFHDVLNDEIYILRRGKYVILSIVYSIADFKFEMMNKFNCQYHSQ